MAYEITFSKVTDDQKKLSAELSQKIEALNNEINIIQRDRRDSQTAYMGLWVDEYIDKLNALTVERNRLISELRAISTVSIKEV